MITFTGQTFTVVIYLPFILTPCITLLKKYPLSFFIFCFVPYFARLLDKFLKQHKIQIEQEMQANLILVYLMRLF